MSQTSRLVHCLREKHPFGFRTNFRQSGDDRLLAILFRTAHAPDVPVRVQPIAFRVDEINSIVFNLCTKTFRKNIRSEEHTSELQSLTNLVCRLLLEKKQS